MIPQPGLENLIFKCIEEYAAGRRHERHGLVTSYDPKTHLAKVKIKPEGIETGWIPIEVRHAGNGFGAGMAGPVTGDGDKSGDQVIVRLQEGEIESCKVTSWVHSKTDKPPTVQSKEYLTQNHSGHHIFFKEEDKGKSSIRFAFNDGDAPKGGQPPPSDNIGTFKFDKDGKQTSDSNKKKQTVTDSNGATQVHDGSGNYTHEAKTIKHNSTAGNITHEAKNNNGNADILHTAANNITNTAKNGNYTRTASNGNIVDTATQILHNGQTNVQGTLNVSQLLSANGGFSGLGGMSMGGLSKLLGGLQASGGSTLGGGTTMTGGAGVSGLLTANNGLSVLGGSTLAGGATVSGGHTVTGGLVTDSFTAVTATITPTTVASLPLASLSTGMRMFVTDATVASFRSIVSAGGGSNHVPVFSDGTNWLVG